MGPSVSPTWSPASAEGPTTPATLEAWWTRRWSTRDGLVELLSLTSGRLTAVWRQEATAINTKAANSTTINFAAAGCYSAFSIQRRFLRQTAAPSQL